jgi:hypothetical protein
MSSSYTACLRAATWRAVLGFCVQLNTRITTTSSRRPLVRLRQEQPAARATPVHVQPAVSPPFPFTDLAACSDHPHAVRVGVAGSDREQQPSCCWPPRKQPAMTRAVQHTPPTATYLNRCPSGRCMPNSSATLSHALQCVSNVSWTRTPSQPRMTPNQPVLHTHKTAHAAAVRCARQRGELCAECHTLEWRGHARCSEQRAGQSERSALTRSAGARHWCHGAPKCAPQSLGTLQGIAEACIVHCDAASATHSVSNTSARLAPWSLRVPREAAACSTGCGRPRRGLAPGDSMGGSASSTSFSSSSSMT